MDDDSSVTNPTNWLKILSAVKTPLSFFTLVMLITQTILFFLVRRAEGVNFQIVLISFLALTFLLVLTVAFLQYRTTTQRAYRVTSDAKVTEYKYEVFLSTPMAALNDKEYASQRQLLSIIDYLKEHCQMKTIMYAGESLDARNKFDPHDISLIDDFDAITTSRFFVMIYPKRIASSVLFEAGIALALGKECRYFVRNRNNLPFLLKQAEQAFSNVTIYEYESLEDIQKVLKSRKCFSVR